MTILEDDCDGCGGVIAIVCLQLFFSSFANLSFILFFVPKNIYYLHFQAGLDKCIPEVENSPHITIYFEHSKYYGMHLYFKGAYPFQMMNLKPVNCSFRVYIFKCAKLEDFLLSFSFWFFFLSFRYFQRKIRMVLVPNNI